MVETIPKSENLFSDGSFPKKEEGEFIMKRLMLVAAALLLGASSAFAGNGFGDGSRVSHYVIGHSGNVASDQFKGNGTDKAYFYRGDGSVEDSYYPGRHLNSPVSRHGVSDQEMHNFGDGSPVNHNM